MPIFPVDRYDVDVPHKHGIAYATQGRSPNGMGNWPINYKAIPCPVGGHKLEYSIVQYEGSANLFSRKIMIAGQRTPIAAVQVIVAPNENCLMQDKYLELSCNWYKPFQCTWSQLKITLHLSISSGH